MLLTIFIAWMVANLAFVLFVIARPPRHLTRASKPESQVGEAAKQRQHAA